LQFSRPVAKDGTPLLKLPDNPKRRQREAHHLTARNGIGTKAQQELKAQYEESRLVGESLRRETKEIDDQRRHELKTEKRKEKHRGH